MPQFLILLILLILSKNAPAKTFDVDISTGRPAASNEAYYHGETIEFRAVRGRSVVTNVEYSCVYYQTNGMDSVWWHTDGLVFHPTNDVGAANYRFFMEGRDDLGRDWHANGLLRLLPSPGFTPNEIELPVARLDFANIEVANAPYYDKAETEAKIAELAPAPGNYAAVSNRAMTALQSYTETDPTVPAWAKAETQPLPPNYSTISNKAMTALQEHQSLANYYNKTETESKIVELAPAPGNYAAVSNAAMTALQSFTETDPTVPAWAKATSKPSYSWSEITSKPTLAAVATSGSYNDLSNKPTIPTVPTNVSAFSNDAGYLTGYTESDPVWRREKSGYARTNEVQLSERGFTGWNVVADTYDDESGVGDVEWWDLGAWRSYWLDIVGMPEEYLPDPVGTEGWVVLVGPPYGGTPEALELSTDFSATNISASGSYATVTATRTALSGYQLGSQVTKPIASESETEALRVGKQDKLPYPTNAIPYAAITGAPVVPSPSGMVSETSVLTRPASGDGVSLAIPSGGTLSANINIAGQCVFAHVTPSGPYTVDSGITLVGYGSWPTNAFQAVFWRVGETHYCNIIRED